MTTKKNYVSLYVSLCSKTIKFVFTLIVTSALLFSCRGKEETSSEGGNGGSGDASKDTEKPGAIDTTAFSVTYQADTKYTYYAHKGTGAASEDWTAACAVTPADTVRDITCVVEASELDLFFFGVGLRVNVPPSMCSFLVQRRPYFYRYLPGFGNATGVDNTAGSIVNSGVAAGANTLTCQYDYKAINGPNCCEGTYTKIVYSNTNVGTATANQSWGGKAANCIAGPAADLSPKAENGYPLGVIEFIEGVGFNNGYFLTPPISKKYFTNIAVANYFLPADHTLTRPLMTTTSTGFQSSQLYHEFDCLNRARETIATIKVMVREWNSVEEFAKMAAGNADLVGVEPGYGTPINDYVDVKDLGEAYPGLGL